MYDLKKTLIVLILVFVLALIFSSTSFAATKTNLSVNGSTSKYSESFRIIATLTDENGTPLEGEGIELSFEGWTLDKEYTDSDGMIDITFEEGLDGYWYNYGKYPITAKYYGSANYAASSAKGYFIIESMPINLEMNLLEKNNKKYASVSLKDIYNNPSSATRINLYVDGKFYTYGISNDNGKYYFDLSDLSSGKHLITARNSDIGKNYIPDMKNMTVEIKGDNSTDQKYASKNESNKSFASMKETGMPIIVILLILLTSLGIIMRKKS